MTTALVAARHRVTGGLGRLSMYRLVTLCLAVLTVIAFVVSFTGELVPQPAEIAATLAVLIVVIAAVDAIAQRLLSIPWRLESSLVTAGILLFVVRPSIEPAGLAGIAFAGAVAAASKYVIAWRGRHLLNPAAAGATALTISGWGSSAWWVGSPSLAAAVIVLGALVVIRTEKVRMVLIFLIVAVGVGFLRLAVQYGSRGIDFEPLPILEQLLFAYPFLFLGAFMLTEPLTLPPRRWQQYIVAAVVGALAGWPISIGFMTLGQERALLIGNLLAFAFVLRSGIRVTLERRRAVTDSVQELTFRPARPLSFRPGQYLELQVPHRRPDARGSRREFSIVSAPSDGDEVRIAFRDDPAAPRSSFKRALAEVEAGGRLAVTGVWGDFVLPRGGDPVLLVAAGIGVTPFVSQLRDAAARGHARDAVLVYVASAASELAFRDELAATDVPVVVFTPDRPDELPPRWVWAGGVRLDAGRLSDAVPDLATRRAYVSGPPRLIADLAPALMRARSLTTDAFSGY